ncbi:MAG: Cof-type HAD-IIB family hydrolase, partial [bacterium]|nr:Cof-type HAD-IIB family hydrolase [bacterium]
CEPRMFPHELLEDVVAELAPWSLNLYDDCQPGGTGRVLLERQTTPECALALRTYVTGSSPISTVEGLAVWKRIAQVALPCNRELAEELAARVRARFGDKLLVLVVRWPLVPCHALEIFHPQANKGSALAHFAQRLGIPQAETLAAGDDTNDLAMLRWAGWAVAMPHSEGEVREAADVVLEGADGQAALAEYLQSLLARRLDDEVG